MNDDDAGRGMEKSSTIDAGFLMLQDVSYSIVDGLHDLPTGGTFAFSPEAHGARITRGEGGKQFEGDGAVRFAQLFHNLFFELDGDLVCRKDLGGGVRGERNVGGCLDGLFQGQSGLLDVGDIIT
jgi:hypothetical protein